MSRSYNYSLDTRTPKTTMKMFDWIFSVIYVIWNRLWQTWSRTSPVELLSRQVLSIFKDFSGTEDSLLLLVFIDFRVLIVQKNELEIPSWHISSCSHRNSSSNRWAHSFSKIRWGILKHAECIDNAQEKLAAISKLNSL